jgi:hypothetical protein
VTADPPGPLAEEATRLFDAIGEWARGAISDSPLTPSAGSAPGPAVGAECQICPVCQLLALVRRAQPDTFAHLADASASLLAALRTVIDRHEHSSARPGGVQHVNLDEPDEHDQGHSGAEFAT